MKDKGLRIFHVSTATVDSPGKSHTDAQNFSERPLMSAACSIGLHLDQQDGSSLD